MFKIGDFSKIANVPITQLRYYDDIDIFKPATTDAFTSYRYYSIEQMPRLNRILALRNLGMSLDQIKRLLDDDVSADELRGMFALRKAQIEEAMREEVMKLKAVEYRLKQIEHEGELSDFDVVLKDVPDQPMFSVRKTTTEWDWVVKLYKDMGRKLTAGNARFKGVSAALIHNAPTHDTDGYDVEVGYIGDESMKEKIATDFDLTLRTVQGGEMATLVHKAENDNRNGYYVVANWVERNGYKIDGAIRELYLHLPDTFESPDLVVEFQFPVVR